MCTQNVKFVALPVPDIIAIEYLSGVGEAEAVGSRPSKQSHMGRLWGPNGLVCGTHM